MKLRQLPLEVTEIFQKVKMPQRLAAHLTLVHDVAATIILRLEEIWPALGYDKQAVLVGAATHDIGKVLHNNELSRPGNFHEEAGFKVLIENGFSEGYARFARTHRNWQQATVSIEDLLVTLADKVWKGKREQALESLISRYISENCNEEEWRVYAKLDDVLCEITKDADQRLAWQNQYPV